MASLQKFASKQLKRWIQNFAKFVEIWSKAATNVCSNCCLLAQEIIVVVAAAAVVAKVNEHFPPFPPQLAAKPKPAPLPPL